MLINGQGESIMACIYNVKVTVFAALLFVIKEVEMSPNQMVCGNELQVKLSILNGLREQHVKKGTRVYMLEKEIEQAQNKIHGVELEIVKMQRKINTTLSEADDIEQSMANMTTPEVERFDELDICENGFVADCCQVNHFKCIATNA